MTLLTVILAIHSCWRWLVIVALIGVTSETAIAAYCHRGASRPFGAVAVGIVDLQLAFGVTLASLSNIIRTEVHTREGLFFALVHIPLMLAVVALAHTGSLIARRGQPMKASFAYAGALFVALTAVPWWRPLLRLP